MNFKKWLEEWDKGFLQSVMNHAEKEGLKIEGTTALIPHELKSMSLQLYVAYRNQNMTKKLVWATWSLAIATIILTGVSLFIK